MSAAASPPAPQLPDRMLAKALTERLIEMVGLRDNVILLDYVNFPDVQTDIHTADVKRNVFNFALRILFITALGRPFPYLSSESAAN